MDRDIFCRLTRLDGSVIELWLPVTQVAIMTDTTHPRRMPIFESLGIVSIEAHGSVEPAMTSPPRAFRGSTLGADGSSSPVVAQG